MIKDGKLPIPVIYWIINFSCIHLNPFYIIAIRKNKPYNQREGSDDYIQRF